LPINEQLKRTNFFVISIFNIHTKKTRTTNNKNKNSYNNNNHNKEETSKDYFGQA